MQAVEAVVKLGNVAGKFLPQSQRGGVLQVGAADFHDRREFFGFFIQRVAQGFDGRNQQAVDFNRGGDVDGGGEAVVGRLRVVDVVVGMHGLVRRQACASDFVGAVGEHFVHVHIGLRARAGLPHHQRELAVELARQHVVGSLHNQIRLLLLDAPERGVHLRGGFFHQRHRVNHRLRQGFAADFEILAAALGLRAPIGFGRDFYIAHGVVFGAGGHIGFS